MKILVIIPAYNEQASIYGVVQSLKEAFPEADYIVINDCSTDQTRLVCRQYDIKHIDLPVNLGIGGGVQTGYKYAVEHDYDIAIQLDGDGQHDPKSIANLIKPIADGNADMVIGSRFIQKDGFQSSSARRFGINFFKHLLRICCGVNITDSTSGFRACSRQLTSFFARHYSQDYPEPEAIISAVKNGYRITEVPVIMFERTGGKSSINIFKSIYYMIKVTLAIVVYSVSSNRKGRDQS